MRYKFVSAAFIATSLTALSSPGVHAEQYCGFVNKAGAIVECGYSSRESCENAIGGGAMCFIRPDVGLGETPPGAMRGVVSVLNRGPEIELPVVRHKA